MPRRAAVWLLLLSAGCYRAHDRGPEPLDAPDAFVPDAFVPDALVPDAFVAPDTGPPDAGIDAGEDAGIDAGGPCDAPFLEPVVRVCSYAPTGALPAGEPSQLTLTFRECTCGPRTCEVRVVGPELEITTRSCPEIAVCEECARDLACAVPPLEPGDRPLRVDGRLVATVPVAPRRPVARARPICWAIQDPIARELTCGWPGADVSASSHCHRELEDVGTAARIDVRYLDDACAPPAECRAQLDGPEIHLTWSRLECTRTSPCGPLVTHTARCVTPPLRAETYRVIGASAAGGFSSILEVRDVSVVPEPRCYP